MKVDPALQSPKRRKRSPDCVANGNEDDIVDVDNSNDSDYQSCGNSPYEETIPQQYDSDGVNTSTSNFDTMQMDIDDALYLLEQTQLPPHLRHEQQQKQSRLRRPRSPAPQQPVDPQFVSNMCQYARASHHYHIEQQKRLNQYMVQIDIVIRNWQSRLNRLPDSDNRAKPYKLTIFPYIHQEHLTAIFSKEETECAIPWMARTETEWTFRDYAFSSEYAPKLYYYADTADELRPATKTDIDILTSVGIHFEIKHPTNPYQQDALECASILRKQLHMLCNVIETYRGSGAPTLMTPPPPPPPPPPSSSPSPSPSFMHQGGDQVIPEYIDHDAAVQRQNIDIIQNTFKKCCVAMSRLIGTQKSQMSKYIQMQTAPHVMDTLNQELASLAASAMVVKDES